MSLVDPRGRPISSALFRKADAPPLGPTTNARSFEGSVLSMPGGSAMMFDLEKLTLDDYKAMRYHPQIHASLSLITFMLHQQDWHIECADKKKGQVIEENMRLIWTRLCRALSQAFWAGYAPCVLEWENTEDGEHIFINKVLDLLPEESAVHWREVESTYKPKSVTGTNIIPPKIKIYDGIDKFGLSYPIPAELTMWYPMLMENNDMYGRKLLKAAFMPWYFSMLIHMYSNRYFERFGEPVPIGRVPFDEEYTYKASDGNHVSVSSKQAMEEILTNLRNRSIVVLPSDRDDSASSGGGRSEYTWDIEYLESNMRGADFERYMARLDEEISLAIFTPTLLMRAGDIGSHNLGVQHTQTWLWSLNALSGDIKEYIDRYIVKRIGDYNFNANSPRAEWVPRSMGKDNPETIRSIISALISTTKGAIRPKIEEMGVALGMTLEEVKIAADPNVDPNAAPAPDTRDRATRNRSGSGPRRVGEPLATGRSIAARIGQQVSKNWQSLDQASLSMGHRRRFFESLVSEGMEHDDANEATEYVYERMEGWLDTVKHLSSEFEKPEDFVELFNRRLTTEIEALADR